jgi:hypothetical protein
VNDLTVNLLVICFVALVFINEKEFGFSPGPFTFVLCIGPFTGHFIVQPLIVTASAS